MRLVRACPADYNDFMAIYHLSVGSVTRSTGRSSVQAVAYLTAMKMIEERRGLVADYTNKQGDVTWETMAPEWANIDKKDLSIWNRLENYEDEYAPKRYSNLAAREKYLASAVTAHTYVFALPRELTKDQNVSLIRDIVQERFVDNGLVATWSIHWEEGNPHVHILVSERAIEKDGTFSYYKVARDLSRRLGLKETRKIFSDKTNELFKSLGMEERIDHRSYAERGIDLVPTQHKGWMAHQRERDGDYSRIGTENAEISEANKEKIAQEPNIILKELVSTQATFSEMDVIRLTQKRMKDDPSHLTQHVIESVMNEAVEVGTGLNTQKRYTSQEYFEREAGILEAFEQYQVSQAAIKIDPTKVDDLIGKLQDQGKESGIVPNEGQVNGIRTLCGDSQLSVMIGRAGTGKTTTLKPVIQLHEEAGYKIWGMAPSATAASQLEADTGCKSDTIAHYAYYWREYDRAVELLHTATTEKEIKRAQKDIDKYSKYLPDSNTLILIDEAGMVGVGNSVGAIPGGWDAIIKAIGNSGAKLILTGDDHQFKPIEAGDVFRRLVHWLKAEGQLGVDCQLCELTEIKRQNVAWMREASHHLAELNVGTALGLYEREGHIQEHAFNIDVYEDMARQYLRNILSKPDEKGIVIAATNEERLALNREIRFVLKENGLLPKKDLLQRVEDGYTVGDKIIFTKNDRGWNTSYECKTPEGQKSLPADGRLPEGFFVQNNMQAVIQSIKPVSIENEQTGEKTETYEIVAYVPDHKAMVTFNLNDYDHFAHAYAVTGWKSQGNTLDWVLAKFSKHMDAHGLYVILTRHREEVSLYYSKEDFTDFKSLVHSFSRVNVKDLVVDYSISDEHQEYWKNVQDYKETGFELLGVSALARNLEKYEGRVSKSKDGGRPEAEPRQGVDLRRERLRPSVEIEAVWQNYRHIEADRKGLAKLILDDWDVHKDYVRQAGLTRESLEIAAGLKKRSLSRLEVQAQMTVEQYVSAALEARTLWRDIRKTHPGIRAKTHPDWQMFEEAREQRGVLANRIYLNVTLHRPFLKETAETLAKGNTGYAAKDNQISYSMANLKAQAEAHQSKMLLQELLTDYGDGRYLPNPVQQDRLKILITYTDNRDMAASTWREVRPKLKQFEGALLKEAFSQSISEYKEFQMKRDAAAFQIMEQQEAFADLAERVGIKLDFDRLKEQAQQAMRDRLFEAYESSLEEMARLEAAFKMNTLVKEESEVGKKVTVSQIYQKGLQPKDIDRDALEYQKAKLFESLKTEPERALFLLLDEYDAQCRKANQIYTLCIEDTEDKDRRPWESFHYPAYKDACHARNDIALEIFEQRDHGQVLSMAEAMGMRFKDVELEEIFARCEQANRTRNIISYQNAKDPNVKGQAALAIRQMITVEGRRPFERKEKGVLSKTAQQAFHAGIDFKELQATALMYGRVVFLAGLSDQKERELFHTLELYEQSSHAVKQAYRECIEESNERSTSSLAVKPWETEKFKEYIGLVTIQDEKAFQLVKGYDLSSINRIAKEMGISVKAIDVEAHRHALRQTLQTYLEGDRTNVPMAAKEVLNWLEFDRHSDHKHTFKVLREQDLWPKDIQASLQEFFEKKRKWRHEAKNDLNNTAASRGQERKVLKPDYKIITYERRQSFDEVNKQLSDRMYELATHILGKPTGKNRDGLRFGRNGSMSVAIKGPNQGKHYSFETGMGGRPLDLIQQQMNLEPRDALNWATDWLGGNSLVIEQRVVERGYSTDKASAHKQSTWTPIVPVPKGVDEPDISENKYLNYMLKDGNKETARYAYRDEQGNLKGYVFRLEKPNPDDPNGKNLKITPPLAYCENERGFRCWRSQGFFGEEKTPYGLEKLAQDLEKPVLVVEGEKKADAAQKMLPEYHVLGWIGGAGSISKTNWKALAGREVVIWPDNDKGGKNAAAHLQEILTSLNAEGLPPADGRRSTSCLLPADSRSAIPDLSPAEKVLKGTVGIVSLPETLPEKWDLADELPEGWTPDTVRNMIREASLETERQISVGGSYPTEEHHPEKVPLEHDVDHDKDHEGSDLSPLQMTVKAKEKSTEPQYSPEEEQVLAYLKEEVSTEKHVWLKGHYAQNLLEDAQSNPLETLGRWQKISNDYSFKPSVDKSLRQKEKEEKHKTLEEKILGYLQNEIIPEKRAWFKETPCRDILRIAEKDPVEGLKKWQDFSNDYRFNPFREYLSDREICVQDYLQKELVEQGGKVSPKYCKEMLSQLLDKPLEAYRRWHYLTGDKTFDPASGTPRVEMEAQELLSKAKDHVPEEVYKSWQENLTRSPQTILKECNEWLQEREREKSIKSLRPPHEMEPRKRDLSYDEYEDDYEMER